MEQNQRHLNFNKFVQERSVQISKFLSDLEMDTKKKGHQALPRSIRRRAMSHNRYRVPRKMRKNIQEDLAKAQTMQKIPKCRKHIRKRRHLITAFKLRSGKVQWLSTHLWSVRRMRMIAYYGYKIAQTSNNKSFRSAYRHFRHNTCLLDLSYFNCLSINLENNTIPLQIKFKNEDSIVSFDSIYQVSIYQSIKREKLLCPAYLIRYKDQSVLNLKIYFHPAARGEISRLKFQMKYKACIEQGQCDLYLLVGPQSINTLSRAMQQYGIVNKQESLSNYFYGNNNKLLYFSKGDSYQIVNKPQIACPIPQQKQIRKSYQANQNISLRQKMLRIYNQLTSQKQSNNISENISHQLFWNYYKQGQNKQLQQTVFKVTLRSKYTHKRTNKVTKQEKKKIIQAQRQSPIGQRKKKREKANQDENSQLSSSLNFSKQVYLQTPIHKNAVLQQIHPIVVGQVGQGLMKGVIILCSNANSCKFWRNLTHCNVKVIGRRQYSHMHLQSNNLLFPQNYAQTNSFLHFSQQHKKSLFEKYIKLPLQKRPDYFTINSPYPFGVKPIKPLIVSIQMVGRGRCFNMSYICQVTNEDLSKISQSLDNGKVGIISSEHKPQVISERKHYKEIEQIESDLRLTHPKRKIIGHITTGGYLFSRSREGGIGFLDLSLTNHTYLQTYSGYVLIRKPSSPHYFLAQIKKHYD